MLLAKPHIYRRIIERTYVDQASEDTVLVIKRSPAKSIHLAKAKADEISHIASYAAKSVPYLSKAENDDYYHFFDHRGMT
jgi:hypothetical protein